MDLEREKSRIISTPNTGRETNRRGFLKVLGGLGAAARLGVAQAQELPQEISSIEPPVDMTEPEVEGVIAEAPLSPVEQLLANTELVDAVYLGHNPVAEFRTTPDSPFMISINPEVSEEERNRFAELVGKSGQHFGYDALEFVVMRDVTATDEKDLQLKEMNLITPDTYVDYFRYNGADVRLGTFGSINDRPSRKLIFRLGYSDQITRFLNDPEFVSKTILPKNMIAVWNMVSKGDQDFMGGNPRNPDLDQQIQSIVNDNFIVFSTK